MRGPSAEQARGERENTDEACLALPYLSAQGERDFLRAS